MIGYIIIMIVTTIIVSIITERMVIKRLELSEGVEIKNGRCKLKNGYGVLVPIADQQLHPHTHQMLTKFYRPFA